ncbi:MAG: spore coat U domain-containing protein [Deltaproteobacteria bacterium]
MKLRATSCLLALALLLVPRAASAMSCTILSVPALAFGNYNVFSAAPLDTSTLISFHCDNVGASTITIGLSRGSSLLFAPRTLTLGAFVLTYNVYRDASHTSVWGDDVTSWLGPLTPLDGVDDSRTVFGRIEPGQNAHAGSYTDTLIVTVTF